MTAPATLPGSIHLAGFRIWPWAVILLLLFECAPIWFLDYFPSQDGPSHLHNAAVIADYASQPAYRDYYRVTPFPSAGNILTQFILAGLLKIVGFAATEKVLLTAYLVLFVASFRYLLRAVAPDAGEFTMFGAILAPNFFLFMGFWNFCFSLVLLMAMLGWYLHRLHSGVPWSRAAFAGWTSAGVVLYLTHSVSLVVCIIAIASIGVPQLLPALFGKTAHRRSTVSVRRAVLGYVAPICCLLPPLLIALTHLPSAAAAQPAPETLGFRLWNVYGFPFLHTVASDPMLVKGVAASVLFAFVAALLELFLRKWNWRWVGLPLAAAICVGIVVFSPDAIGMGSYIQVRFSFYAMLFFVLWIASAVPSWPRVPLNIIAASLLLVGIHSALTRYPVLSAWSHRLSALVRVGRAVRPGATVLPVTFEGVHEIDPLLHAVGLLSPQGIVDLANYEALSDLFTTKFRPERSPLPWLGDQLLPPPPVFDVAAYEGHTRGHVDYLMVLSETNSAAAQELRLYPTQMAAFALVGSDESGTIRLYARR